MGLAGPRKRQKISHDPNNTRWSTNTSTFGHKILSSQGWTPGQTLGRHNAYHATHYTKASASHVRVALREDNLGLGAKPGSGQGPGECTGLGSFQDLLGRLNGRTEATIEKERQGRATANRMVYAERRYGGWSRFVSAGYLVGGDVMRDQPDITSDVDDREEANVTEMTRDSSATRISRDTSRSDRKAKKRKIKNYAGLDDNEKSKEERQDDGPNERTIRAAEKAERRAAKARRKEDRQKRRQEKPAGKCHERTKSLTEDNTVTAEQSSISPSRSSASGSATPVFMSGRHIVRQRYIMQKKAAMLDTKALNEILMVKV